MGDALTKSGAPGVAADAFRFTEVTAEGHDAPCQQEDDGGADGCGEV